jgi:hypothetical protein
MSMYESIRLPVGIRRDGGVFRDVLIDEMSGVDEEIISNPKYKNAPVRGLTALLQRCVQEIPALMEQKADRYALAPLEYLRSMYQVDRDFLLLSIRRISMGDEVSSDWQCRYCKTDNTDQIRLSELPFVEWPDSRETTFAFEDEKGFLIDGKVHHKGTLKLLSGVDAEQLANVSARSPETVATALLSTLVVGFEDGVKPTADAFRKMRTMDRQRLGEIVNSKMPGVQMATDLTCADCGRLNERVQVDASGFFSGTSPR